MFALPAAASGAARPQQLAYQAISTEPITAFETYEPMVSTAFATSNFGLSLLGFCLGSNPVMATCLIAALLPALRHKSELYTDWIPKLAYTLPVGEVIRKLSGLPNVNLGLAGWDQDSSHSNHFDERLAQALIGLFQLKNFDSHADFDLAGSGGYSKAMNKAGVVNSHAFDFSTASIFEHHSVVRATLALTAHVKYDLVTSFEVVSKTKPGEEIDYIVKLINSTNPGGMIAMSCAIPGQAGPNINWHTNEEIISIFESNGCKYNPEATIKMRRAANPMHPWLKKSLMVFDKT